MAEGTTTPEPSCDYESAARNTYSCDFLKGMVMKQTQLMTVDDCSGLSDDELKDMANTFGEKCQQAAKKTVEDAITAGTALLAMRSRVADGEWLKWLGANWNYTRQTAQTYVTLAVNVKRFTSRTPDSIREAMRLIGDQKSEEEAAKETPRAERKTGRVEVVTPEPDEPGQQSVQPDENAVPAEPKTNTKHRPETAKAKEEDRPAPMKVTPEIVEEPGVFPERVFLSDFSVAEMLEYLKASADDAKKRAKELRRAADELDPPKKFSPPDADDVAAYCRERKNGIDAEAFVAHYSANGWKLSNGNKMADWKSAVITWEKHNGSGNGRTSTAGSGRGKPHTDF